MNKHIYTCMREACVYIYSLYTSIYIYTYKYTYRYVFHTFKYKSELDQ